ncbi:MAG: T9SS type A sorting domain-containing protein [Cyclobacteriaceae bacterium]
MRSEAIPFLPVSATFLILFFGLSGLKAQFIFEYENNIPLSQDGQSLSLAWAGGLNSGQYYNIDIDRDGQQDLLVFDRSSQQYNPFILEEDGYRFAPEYIPFFPATVDDFLVLADYDGDGKQDFFTSSGRRGITVYRNVGDEHLQWELVADPLRATGFSGFEIAIQVNATDVPAISDIDGDGDLDVVTYNVNGRGVLEYYQNMSMETTGNASSLIFEAREPEWGGVRECDCNIFAFDGQSCSELTGRTEMKHARQEHVGAKTLLALDVDNDGDKDILTSDEGCGELYFLENTGNADDARFKSFDAAYLSAPEGTTPINFPAAYWVDVTGDGVKDLVVASNAPENAISNTNTKASSWLFENTGSNELPNFSFRKADFLQDEMLDVGENAAPVLADIDADGDDDLLIASRGKYENDNYTAGVVHYENTGTNQEPAYEFRDNNYLSLSEWKLQQLKVYFTDLNGDGLPDMLVSGSENPFVFRAKLYFLENQASSGEPWRFLPEQRQLIDINLNYADHLAFSDADGDGDIDLLLARQSGDLEYYENHGTTGIPDWQLANENAGGITANVLRRGLSILLHDIDNDQKPDLISTDDSGVLTIRSDFLSKINQEATPDTVKSFHSGRERNIYLGNGAYFAATRPGGSGSTLLMAGNPQGGIQLLTYDPEKEVERPELLVYPNPAGVTSDIVNVLASADIRLLQLISITGAIVSEHEPRRMSPSLELDTASLASGVYLLRVTDASGSVSAAKLLVR